jgi:hypothetical protein
LNLLPTPETLRGRAVDVALGLLADTGAEDLLKFLNPRKIAEALDNESETNIRSAFDPRGGKTMSRVYLATMMLTRALEQLRIETRANSDGYLQAAEAVSQGGGAEGISAAVVADVRDFIVDDADEETRARERMYYLALTLADNEAEIREELARGYQDFRDNYAPAYKAFLEATHRRIASDTTETALRQALGALMEGFTAHQRIGVGIPEDVVADAVMRVFLGYTVGPGEATRTVEEQALGRPAPVKGSRGPLDGIVHHTGESLYEAAIEAIEALTDPEAEIGLCSLHGHRGQRHGGRSEREDALRSAIEDHAGAGGVLNRLATYLSPDRLDQDLKEIESLCTRVPGARVEARALVIDTPPVLAPLLVGEEVAFLARDDHHLHGVDGGIEIRGSHGLQMCALAFRDLWQDHRSEWIWTKAGPYTEGIQNTRERLGHPNRLQ